MAKKKNIKKNYKLRILLCLCFAILFAGIFLFEPQIYNLVNNTNKDTLQNVLETDLIIHFIDVGQGDAIAIELPDEKIVLIDSGTHSSKTNLVSYLNTNVLKNGSKNIDYFIITHPHEDHIGGANAIFENFDVLSFYRPTVFSQSEKDFYEIEYGQEYANSLTICNTLIFNDVVLMAENENCYTTFYSYIDLPVISQNNYSFSFLTPQKIAYDNFNNYSPLIMLEYYDKTVLFTGDAEIEIENEYLGLGIDEPIDVLKVGHHGSSSSCSQDFLNRIQPQYAVISVGKENSYGHPTQSTLSKLESIGAQTFRTDKQGTIIVGLNAYSNLIIFASGTNGLPVKIEVWEIYASGCLIAFYLIIVVSVKQKKKIKK